jgi:hypothetical protein
MAPPMQSAAATAEGWRSGLGVAASPRTACRERPLGPHQLGKAPIRPLPTGQSRTCREHFKYSFERTSV